MALLGTVGQAVAGSLGLPGFEVGGATGGSDPSRVAGLVHEKEFVFDAVSTSRIGVSNLEAIRQGRMPGYATGGYVSTARDYDFLTPVATSGASAPIDTRPIISIQNKTSVPNVHGEVEETRGPRGQRQFTLSLSDAVATGLTAPGGRAGKTMREQFGMSPGAKRRS